MLTPQSENTPATRESLATLTTGILNDARKLVELELELAVTVLRDEAKALGKSTAIFGVGLALMVVAVLLSGLALAAGAQALSGLPAWSCQLMVALFFGIASALAFRKVNR